jgi:hypothetical protein
VIEVAAFQDDPRKYPSKEDAGFMTGATGGFFGGEVGVQQFVKQGKFNMADATTVKKRQTIKDVSLVVGLVVVAVAGAYGLQQLGLVDFDLQAATGNTAGDLLGATAGLSGVDVPSSAVRTTAPPVRIALPAVSPDTLKLLLLGGGTVGGGMAVGAITKGTAKALGGAVKSAKRNTARLAVLAAAGLVGYWLLQQ